MAVSTPQWKSPNTPVEGWWRKTTRHSAESTWNWSQQWRISTEATVHMWYCSCCTSITLYHDINQRLVSVASEKINDVYVSAESNITLISSQVLKIRKRVSVGIYESDLNCRTASICYCLNNVDYSNKWLLLWTIPFLHMIFSLCRTRSQMGLFFVTRVCANRGVLVSKMFSPTLTTICKRIAKEKRQQWIRVAMPASTKMITATEIKTKSRDFTIRRSLIDWIWCSFETRRLYGVFVISVRHSEYTLLVQTSWQLHSRVYWICWSKTIKGTCII